MVDQLHGATPARKPSLNSCTRGHSCGLLTLCCCHPWLFPLPPIFIPWVLPANQLSAHVANALVQACVTGTGAVTSFLVMGLCIPFQDLAPTSHPVPSAAPATLASQDVAHSFLCYTQGCLQTLLLTPSGLAELGPALCEFPGPYWCPRSCVTPRQLCQSCPGSSPPRGRVPWGRKSLAPFCPQPHPRLASEPQLCLWTCTQCLSRQPVTAPSPRGDRAPLLSLQASGLMATTAESTPRLGASSCLAGGKGCGFGFSSLQPHLPEAWG